MVSEQLNTAIEMLLNSEQAYAFVCCASNADGDPELLIVKGKVPPATLLQMMQTAQDKALVTGTVRGTGGTLKFQIERGDQDKLETVTEQLSGQVPALSTIGFGDGNEDDDWNDDEDEDDDGDWGDDEDDDWGDDDDDDWGDDDDDDWGDDEDKDEDEDEDEDDKSSQEADSEDDDWEDDEDDDEEVENPSDNDDDDWGDDDDDDWGDDDDDDWGDDEDDWGDDDDDDWGDDDDDLQIESEKPTASTSPETPPSLGKSLAKLEQNPSENWAFVYCSADSNGGPILLIEQDKVTPKAVMQLMKTAKNKVLVMGKIQMHEGRFVFLANKPDHPEFANHLANTFNNDFPGLANAWVRPQTWTIADEQPAPSIQASGEESAGTPDESMPESGPTSEIEDLSAEEWLNKAMAANTSVQQAANAAKNSEELFNRAMQAAQNANAPVDSARNSLAKLRETMVLRPQPGDARRFAPMVEALGSARLAVSSATSTLPALAQAHYDAQIALIEVIEAQALEDEELGNALALAEASGLDLPTRRPPAPNPNLTPHSETDLGTPGDTPELLEPAVAAIKQLGKGLKDLKLRSKGKSFSEMVTTSAPTDSVKAIAAAAKAARDTGNSDQLITAQNALKELMAAVTTTLTHGLDTGKQAKQWLEWKDRFPSDQQACLTSNVQQLEKTIGELIDLAEPLSFGH